MSMSRRRFSLLAVALVALNLVLWLAPPGLALRQAVIAQLFGPRMVRAEVIVADPSGTPQDYRIDRGVITSVTPTSIVLSERDGTTASIPIAATTTVTGLPRVGQLRRGLRVLVLRLANSPAQQIQVEGRGQLP